MSGIPAPGSPARRGLFGVLRSWLQAHSGASGLRPEDLSGETGGAFAPFGGAVRILVADDNPVNLMVISALMEMRGLSPLLAADGAEAVALACGLQFDLVLMDLQMPILDGLEATSAIRHFEATHARPAVPVVAYSSHAPGGGLLARHGLNGSLAKPCSDEELDDCLVRWCPAYRPAPAEHGVRHGLGYWQPAILAPETGRAALG